MSCADDFGTDPALARTVEVDDVKPVAPAAAKLRASSEGSPYCVARS